MLFFPRKRLDYVLLLFNFDSASNLSSNVNLSLATKTMTDSSLFTRLAQYTLRFGLSSQVLPLCDSPGRKPMLEGTSRRELVTELLGMWEAMVENYCCPWGFRDDQERQC